MLAGVVARVESLPLAHLHCTVRTSPRCSLECGASVARGLRAGADGCFAIHAAGGWAV